MIVPKHFKTIITAVKYYVVNCLNKMCMLPQEVTLSRFALRLMFNITTSDNVPPDIVDVTSISTLLLYTSTVISRFILFK